MSYECSIFEVNSHLPKSLSYWLYFCISTIRSLREKCPYSGFFWSVFSRIWTKYGDIRSISPYSVQMRENTDQKNPEYGHFSRSGFKTVIENILLSKHGSDFLDCYASIKGYDSLIHQLHHIIIKAPFDMPRPVFLTIQFSWHQQNLKMWRISFLYQVDPLYLIFEV